MPDFLISLPIGTNFASEKPIKSSSMNIVKILILLIAMVAVSINMDAQSSTYSEALLKGKKQSNNGRPKAPSLQRITCAYDGEYLVFDFVLPEGQCELTVRSIDNTNVVCETFDSSDLVAEVFVGELSDCEIELTTQKGNTYSGVLSVDNE